MKINRQEKQVLFFDDICKGSVFFRNADLYDNLKTYYMKIAVTGCNNNAVDIESGELYCMEYDEPVVAVNGIYNIVG